MSKYGIQCYRVCSPRELCRVTLYPNPMAVGLPWTWPKVTFCSRVFCCCPTGTFLLCPPRHFCALQYMLFLLPGIHAPLLLAWWSLWILYNPDYVPCHHSTNMYWSARSETQGDWKQTQPLLLVELPSHLCETPFPSPCLCFFPTGMSVYVSVHTHVHTWLHVCIHVCVHIFTCVYTHVHTYLLQHRCTLDSTDWWILLFHQTKFFTLRDHTSLFHFIIKSPSLSL